MRLQQVRSASKILPRLDLPLPNAADCMRIIKTNNLKYDNNCPLKLESLFAYWNIVTRTQTEEKARFLFP